MGWNSWDCFGTTVTEAQVRENAKYMADHLSAFGWQYIVVDIQWYEPAAEGHRYREGAPLELDEWGRLLPAQNRFVSARAGAGFKPLTDYVHGLGLKFGLHLLRGIPRCAVEKNLPVKGTSVRARDIADPANACPWNPDMFGVDLSKPGAQAYYDSVFELFSRWGVDYVKLDDISRPYHRHEAEIEAVRRAIDKSGRAMVLSLSPGATALSAAEHAKRHANLWRISDDFWDNWDLVYDQFALLDDWNPHRGVGYWPDADMLPFGVLDLGRRNSRLTADEQRTVMSLWCIARSPLMHGGDMTKMDRSTLGLLNNPEVIAVNQYSLNNRPLTLARGSKTEGLLAWVADVPDQQDKYVALFNTRDEIPLRPEQAAFAAKLDARSAPVSIDVDVSGCEKLFLVVDDGRGRNAGHPFVVWGEPRLVSESGAVTPLSSLTWTRATSRWGEVFVNRTPRRKGLTLGGKVLSHGLGVHIKSVLSYELSPGARRFQCLCGFEDSEPAAQDERNPKVRVRVLVFALNAPPSTGQVRAALKPEDLGWSGSIKVRDLWNRADLGVFDGEFAPLIPFHGAGLYKVTRV